MGLMGAGFGHSIQGRADAGILENALKTRWGKRLGGAAGTVALLLTASRAGVALAEVNGYLSATTSYDDNLFRAPDGQVFAGVAKADTVEALGGGGVFSLTNEHFQLNATGDLGQTWYTKNSFLDSLGYDGTVELTASQKFIDLDIQASQSRALSSFADIRSPVKDLQTVTRTAARVGLAATGDIHIVFDAKFNRDTNTNAQIAQADYNQSTFGGGLGYFSPTKNNIVLEELRSYTEGLGEQNFIIDAVLTSSKINYVDDTTMLQLSYSPSPVFQLFAQAGYLRRTDRSIFHSNTNTPVGLLRLSYVPDSVIEVDLSAGRQLSSQSYLIIEGIKDTYIRANPTLKFSNGLKASFDINYDHREYGEIPQLGLNVSNSSDDSLRYDASLTYLLLNHYQIAVTGYHEERHSNTLTDTYTDNGLMVTLTLRSARPSAPQTSLEPADYLLLP